MINYSLKLICKRNVRFPAYFRSPVKLQPRPIYRERCAAMKIRCQDLYEAVWNKPVRTLAKEWGLSDVGLAKVCRRYDIPLPPLGHWAKVAVGRGMRRPPLTGNPDVQITFDGNPSLKKTQLSEQGKAKLLPALAAVATAAAVDTPERLAKWTQKTARALSKKTDPTGILSCWKESFRVSVSEPQKSRAINLLNAIETALSAAGMNGKSMRSDIMSLARCTERPSHSILGSDTNKRSMSKNTNKSVAGQEDLLLPIPRRPNNSH